MVNSPTDQVLAYLMNWKKKLLNLGRGNKLINYRMTKTRSIEIVAPESEEILSRLLVGGKWEFYIPPSKPDDATEEELNKWRLSWPKRKTKQAQIHHEERKRTRSAIRTLRRKSVNAINDMGFHVLYLAYGFLNWQEPKEQGGKKNVSPLFLFELTIDVPRGEKPSTFFLHEEDWKFNPSLLRHLQQDYGVDIESILDQADQSEDPSHFFATIEERVRIALPKSSVSDEVRLDIFQFSKEAIYRDLDENSAIIAEHDFIQSMCGVEDAAERLDFTEPDIERLDETNPPENMHNILDADSSQLACVIACAEGRSFVMDGPPGTGKSQTIANMIAELLAEGKKVLFVSEKAAALEVVQNRLTSRGLHHYALPLHSESATRKNFVDELYKALNFHPEVKFDKLSIRKLKSTRKALSDHVLEMNRHHEEVESTLFIMIGRAISLQHIPLLPALDDDSIEITSESIESVRECADQIIDQWKIHSKGSDYSWFGFNRKYIGAGERFEVNEILNNLSSRTSDLQDNLTISSKEIHVVAPNTKEDGWAIIEHLNTINNCGKINYLVFTPEGYTEIKSTYDRLKECHLEINRLTSESPFHITNSHLEFTIDEIIALHSSVEYVISAPFFPTDYYVLITGDSLNLWINGSKSIDQALARLVEISGVFEEEWPSLTSLKKKSFDDLSILSRHFGDRSEPPFSWLKLGQSTVLQQLAADCISQVTEFREAEQALLQKYNQNVLSKGFVQASSVIVDMREKWWRMFSSSYRKAKKFVKTTSKTNEFPTNQDLSFATNLNQEMDRLTRMFDSEWKVIVNKTSLSNFDLNLIEKRIDCLKTIDELRSQGLSSQDLAKLYSDGPIQLRLLDALHQSMIENELIDAELLKSKPLKLGASVNWKISTIEKNWNEFYTHLMDLKQFIDKCEHNFTGIDIEGLKKGLLSIEGIQNNRNCINEILNDTHIKLDGFYESDTTDWHLKDEYLKQINGLLEYQENPFTEGEVQIIIHTALKMSEKCESALKSFEEGMKTYSKFFDEHRREPLFDLRFDNLRAMINVQLNEIDTLDGYLRLKQEIVEAENLGLSSLLETFTERCIDKALLPDAFERALLNNWIEEQLGKEFNGFDSSSHKRERELFIELDQNILDYKCATIMELCNERRPKHRLAFAATINREHQKKRRHLPIRKLIADGMDFILSLKPCVMMSPLSVSHFLPPQKDLFDVVIFDEASQVRPEEAINCIYRGKQTIVVGDQKQLPPTDFFSRSIDDDDDDEVDDFDSVLDIAKAGAGIRSLSLMWHYRSQHEDLITFSNHRFYDSRLFTFPSAMEEHDRLGISLTKVDGIYDRGGSRTNLIEAEAVYNKIKDVVTSEPDLTIGVVAFSGTQRNAIYAVIEKRRQHDPVMDEWLFSHETRLDGFFVKNLENVQGDERDVIIFSTGYGKDQNDKFTNNFGPVGKKLGWRRLNVAITRARRRLEVITSIEAGWIKPTSEAVRHFKKFLEYAEHGPSILEIDLTDSLGDAESPFEEEVIRTIQSWGYEVVPQVGCASYRIDLGVRHPTRKGTYCLAIECDGAMYHSSKVARDRDRIRQQVLEGLGWRIHRIWGPTWYNERKVAEDALKVALEEASSKGPLQIFRKKKNEQESFVVTVNEIDETNLKDIVSDYEDTSLQSSWKGKDGFYEDWEKSTIAQQIEKVIKKESPIHFELMVHRIRDAWRFKSASKKMTERTMNIFNQSVNKSGITKDQNGFIWSSSKHSMVKARGPFRNGDARNAKHVPMEEIILVFKELKLMSRDTITKDEMYKRTADLFGWTRRGAVVNKRLEASLRKMKRD